MMQNKLKEKFKYPMLNSLSSFYSIANEINLPNYMLRGQPLSPYERNCKIQLEKHINGKIFLVHSSNHFCFSILERFSFECRKVIGFALSTRCDWLKRFAPPFHPIRSKTKANCDALACIFPRFASATCNYFEF